MCQAAAMSKQSLPDRPPPHTPLQSRTLGFLLREVYGRLQGRVYEAVAAAGSGEVVFCKEFELC